MKTHRLMTCTIVLLLTASACRLAVDTSAHTPIPSGTPAKVPTVTLQPSNTPTQNPTQTPASTATAQPTLSEAGPWILANGESGLWAANPDGSGLRHIYDMRTNQLDIGGHYAAFLEEVEDQNRPDLVLKIFSLPGGEVTTITGLMPEVVEPTPEGHPPLDGITAVQMALSMGNLDWSPDGTRLAFISAHASNSADLYLYTPEDGSVTLLSETPDQAFRPTWSPDGRHIVFMEANSFGTGAGYDMTGVWLACADGSCQRLLYEPGSGDEMLMGWISDDTLLLYSFNAMYEDHNLRTFNIETGENNVLWSGRFADADLDPESGTVLVVIDDIRAASDPEIEAGLYFVRPDGAVEETQVTDFFSEKLRAYASWHAGAGVFLVKLSNEFISLSPEGEIELIVPHIIEYPRPVPSPDGDVWVWLDDGDIVLNGPEIEIQILFPGDSHPVWGPDGETVLFVHEGGLTVGRIDDLTTTSFGSGLTGDLRWMGF